MPDSAHNPARISFIQYFKWDSVVTFSQKEEIHSLAINDLVTQLERANISCSSTLSFSENDYKEQLKVLKDLDTRIIIGSFSDQMAVKVFCEAHHLGMFGDYVWILPESENESYWNFEKSNCTAKNLHDTVENVIFVSSFNHIVGHEKSISGLVSKSQQKLFKPPKNKSSCIIEINFHSQTKVRFEEELAAMNITEPYSRNILTTYDAIWSMALVLKNAEELWRNESQAYALREHKRLNQFDYNRADIANDFVRQFSRLKFQGISVSSMEFFKSNLIIK
jgi:gamma-aminobutyric acid type B receptor